MGNMPKDMCETCIYWRPLPIKGTGCCARYAPKPSLTRGIRASWVQTIGTDWCGEHRRENLKGKRL